VLHALLLLLLAQQAPEGAAHVVAREGVAAWGHPLSGSDYLLIAAAARHPAMRGADLSCYRIYVHEERGARRVIFLEARDRLLERVTDEGTEITYLPQDPNCRSISFVMRSDGRVGQVIYTRH
jgi:hypothetical protein